MTNVATRALVHLEQHSSSLPGINLETPDASDRDESQERVILSQQPVNQFLHISHMISAHRLHNKHSVSCYSTCSDKF